MHDGTHREYNASNQGIGGDASFARVCLVGASRSAASRREMFFFRFLLSSTKVRYNICAQTIAPEDAGKFTFFASCAEHGA